MSSPLVLGFNMSNAKQMDRVWPIITNKEAIAIDHAWSGSPGMLYKTLQNNTVEIWAKPLPGQKVAILVLNARTAQTTVTVSVAEDVPGQPKGTMMRDVWNHKDVAIVGGEIPLTLNAHDSTFAILEQTISLKADDEHIPCATATQCTAKQAAGWHCHACRVGASGPSDCLGNCSAGYVFQRQFGDCTGVCSPPPPPHCPRGCTDCTCSEIKARPEVKKVHYVTMHHFDLGWDDTVKNVLAMYLNSSGTFQWRDSYAPGSHSTHPTGLLDRSLDVIDALHKRGGTARLVLTTWSYLISMYVDCPQYAGFPCPSSARVARMEAAIRRGDITWHANPLNR